MAKQPHKFFIKIMMKKILIFFICTLLFIGLISCNKPQETPVDTNTPETSDGATIITSANNIITYVPDNVHEGEPIEIKEILLPEDGQKIVYEPAFELYNDSKKGYSLIVNSAERNGEKIIFYTSETRYCFDLLSAILKTPADELFIGLNGEKQEDGTFKYVVQQYTKKMFPEDATFNSINEIKELLGEKYDPSKSYYYTLFYYVTDVTDIADVSQTVAE